MQLALHRELPGYSLSSWFSMSAVWDTQAMGIAQAPTDSFWIAWQYIKIREIIISDQSFNLLASASSCYPTKWWYRTIFLTRHDNMWQTVFTLCYCGSVYRQVWMRARDARAWWWMLSPASGKMGGLHTVYACLHQGRTISCGIMHPFHLMCHISRHATWPINLLHDLMSMAP